MERVKHLNKWANAHTNFALDAARILLGIFLFLKGTSFVTGNTQISDELDTVSNFTGGMFIFHYVAAAHIMGGIMIAFGLLTRWAIWAQLPILFGAVIVSMIVNSGFVNVLSAILALIACLFFLVYGSGKHSADYYFKMQQ
jgi:putative oxidoreductase